MYRLRKPTLDGRTKLLLTPHQLLDRLAQLVTPPRRHKHRYCGVLAPNARLRAAVTASAGPAGSTLQVIEQARERMALPVPANVPDPPADDPRSALSRAASRCWALLLVRIYECLPLLCPRCGQPMRIIAFVLDPPVIERMELLRNPAFGDDCGTSGSRPRRRRCCRRGRRRRGSWRWTSRRARRRGRTWTIRPGRTPAGSDPIAQVDEPEAGSGRRGGVPGRGGGRTIPGQNAAGTAIRRTGGLPAVGLGEYHQGDTGGLGRGGGGEVAVVFPIRPSTRSVSKPVVGGAHGWMIMERFNRDWNGIKTKVD